MFAFETLRSDLETPYRSDYTGTFYITIDSQTGVMTGTEVTQFQNDFWLTHGWSCWLAWTVFCLVLIWSVRYGTVYWRYSMQVHAVLGTLIVLITVFFSAVGIYKAKRIKPQTHAYIGLTFMIVVGIEAVLGVIGYVKANDWEWKTGQGLKIKKYHAYFGYLLAFVAQYEIQIGVTQYDEEWGENNWHGYASYIFFFGSLGLMEAHH